MRLNQFVVSPEKGYTALAALNSSGKDTGRLPAWHCPLGLKIGHYKSMGALPLNPGLCRFLLRDVLLASPPRQHPFRMPGEPFRSIVLAAHQALLE
jgi:hypothetical protein